MNLMKHYLAVLLFISLSSYSQSNLYIESKLFELPDVIFTPIVKESKSSLAWELRIKQPIDHNNPELGHFYQRAFLNHINIDNPVVFVTEGYTCTSNRITELANMLNANQISVEHRYFGESVPDSVGYEYLNLFQATADLHHINRLFKTIYKSKWISTGISKGGATTIFYKYFYPDDVSASVPYVAPINTEFEEKRIYNFLDTIGSDTCRRKIFDFQVSVLEKREEIIPLIKFYSKGAKLSFSYLSIEEAFEFAVLEYPFSFFQWGYDCNDIPPINSSAEVLANYLLDYSGVDFFADASMTAYGPHYYQSATEMGYYGYETEEFKKLLESLPTDRNPHAAFVPNKQEVKFDGKLLKDVNNWLENNGNHIIYIYGANDTWSASAVAPSEKVDALWLFMPDKSHGDARIRNMNSSQKQLLVQKLKEWLGIEIEN